MSITVSNQLATAIISAIVTRVPDWSYDYDRAEAAPLATPPADYRCRRRRKPMCDIERAIRARDLAATVAALQ